MALSKNARKALDEAMPQGNISKGTLGKEIGDAIDALHAAAAAADVPALQENSGAIGGSPTANIPNLAPTYVARTGSNSGTAQVALVAEGSIALSTSNTYTDAAVNTAVNTVVGKLETNIASLVAVDVQQAADIAAVRQGVRDVANTVNLILTAIKAAGLMS